MGGAGGASLSLLARQQGEDRHELREGPGAMGQAGLLLGARLGEGAIAQLRDLEERVVAEAPRPARGEGNPAAARARDDEGVAARVAERERTPESRTAPLGRHAG